MQTIEIDPIHPTLTEFEMPLIDDVWGNKYKWTTDADMNDTVNRVVDGIYAKDPNGEAQQLMRWLMLAGLWMPGGRILAGAGTSKIVTLMNCFSGDTKFVTAQGVKQLNSVGPHKVLTRRGWKDAQVQSFGTQHVNDYIFKPVTLDGLGGQSNYRRTIRATADHRWILDTGEETTSLGIGQKVLAEASPDIGNKAHHADGFRHGFVFGDGTHNRTTLREVSGGYPLGTMHFVLRLCGAKADYLSWFKDCRVGSPPACKGDPVVYLHTNRDLKALPPAGVSQDYILGFIEGWNAADGSESISGPDSTSIFSKNLEALEWLTDHAPYAGYAVVGHRRYSSGKTNYGGKGELWVCTLRKASKVLWEVVDINDGGEEEVFCAVVPRLAEFVLAGGILTGNCYVNETLTDSMTGIHNAIGNTMFTLQQGGGIGTDFSPLRPSGASLKRTGPGSAASGPLPFMKQWDATSQTIKSAGDRRGAMMGTISDTHPDMPAFIVAKQNTGELKQFNMSVLVSDAFMEAVEADAMWALHFPHEPSEARPPEIANQDFIEDGVHQYVYSVWKARELWDMIMEGTYVHAEPGVIFIDRVNDLNNLSYCEDIRCTNPCGEQPLPPNGTCNLGAVNLSRLVRDPFTPDARVDWDLLHTVVVAGIRFLDNVIDVTQYPLEAQKEEEENKRRLGLGISGLADCLAQLGVVYGSPDSEERVEEIMKAIAVAAYESSAMLAQERGAFPLYDEAILKAPFIKKLPEELQATIADLGLRNGVLLTIAPTGTTSLVYGNISSGLEPNFAFSYNRQVFSSNNAHNAVKYEEVTTYLWRLYKKHLANMYGDNTVFDPDNLPNYMVTAQELGVTAHLRIQAACQKWVDASISKTINVPTHCSFEHFKAIYMEAYAMGCKGCTTYRPNDESDIGSVLEVASSEAAEGDDPLVDVRVAPSIRDRPDFLQGLTYKVKWPSWNASIFITINHDEEGVPFEIFLQSKDARHQEWITALTIMMSGHMRRGDYLWIPEELKAIHSVGDTAWVGGKFYGSVLARIGEIIQQHYNRMGVGVKGVDVSELPPGTYDAKFTDVKVDEATGKVDVKFEVMGERCPACSAPAYIHSDGCGKCTSCGHSTCG